MINADQLVQKALDALKTNEFSKAKRLLKEAASLAPLRTDIRELLTYAIEKESSETGSALSHADPRETAKPHIGRNTAAGRSTKLFLLTGLVIGVLLAVGILAAVVVPPLIRRSANGTNLANGGPAETPAPTASPETTPEPTPDPQVEERRRLEAAFKKHVDNQQYDDARETLRAILATDPPQAEKYQEDMARMHFYQGLAAEEKNNRDRAIKAYRKAVEIDPDGAGSDDIPYTFRLGFMLYKRASLSRGSPAQSDLREAGEALEQAARVNPDWLHTYETLALVHIKLGDRLAATRYYKLIMDRAPDTPQAEKAEKVLRSMGALR